MTRQTAGYIALTAIVSFLLGVVATGSRPARGTDELRARSGAAAPVTTPAATAPAPTPDVPGQPIDFAAVAARMNAAVVNLDAASRGTDPRRCTAPLWRRDLGDDQNAP